MEEAWEILDYLPLSYRIPAEQEYIHFLWESFQSNYDNGKYQFSFLAYHMLYMSFVYFIVWQIKNNYTEDFQKAMVGFNKDVEKQLLGSTSPFTFSEVNESNIFRFLKLIDCQNDKIGHYTQMVKKRNETAHANGNIFFKNKESIHEYISEILRLVSEIQDHSHKIVSECFESFLLESYDENTRELSDVKDQIREVLIHKNYLSKKDIELCLQYDVSKHQSHPDYTEIKSLFEVFEAEYKQDE